MTDDIPAPASAPTALAPVNREPWIDVAKGIAITLVVLFHSTMYLGLAGVVGPLTTLNPLLDTFRMPLFFFMSGIVGARAVTLTYRGLFRRRLVLLLYLYVVWSAAQHLFAIALPPITEVADEGHWWGIVNLFVIPNANLWFIYALPLFFTIAWLTRSWPRWLPLVLSAVVSVLFSSGYLHTATAWDKMGRYLFFFLLALQLGSWVRSVAPRTRWWHAVAVIVIYGALLALVVKAGLIRAPFVLFALSIIAVCVGITVAVVISRIPPLDFVRHLGTRTLPIYLVHTFPMVAVASVIVATGVEVPSLLAAVMPIVLTVVAILLSLALYHWLRGVRGVFTVPVASWADTRTVLDRSEPVAVKPSPGGPQAR
ncbi:MAG: acyltransferase family protein [Leifsonia flava]